MPLDPQARRVLDALKAADAELLPELSVAEMRRRVTPIGTRTVEDRAVAGPGGPLRLRIYTPWGAPPLPVLVYFHGGGFVLGSVERSDPFCRVLADWSACIVVS